MDIFIIFKNKFHCMETDRQIGKCMIKRSKLILSLVFSISLIKFVIIGTLIMGSIFVPILYVNASIIDYIYTVFSISRPGIISGVGVLITLIVSLIESMLVLVCISCLPIFEKYADKIMVWIGDFP